eukprot:1044711-Prymnesium_polylepis.1
MGHAVLSSSTGAGPQRTSPHPLLPHRTCNPTNLASHRPTMPHYLRSEPVQYAQATPNQYPVLRLTAARLHTSQVLADLASFEDEMRPTCPIS